MARDPIPDLMRRIDARRIRRHLFYLAKDPLPFRKLNSALPGHEESTLDEADDYIVGKLESWGHAVEKEACLVQAFRRDRMKNIHHQYSRPDPHDPWWIARNLYAKKAGSTHPDEILLFLSHKDSQSWIDSPGANDNAIGTAANMELARVLADYPSRRSMWFLFCNEEHWPWTSKTAARNARMRGEKIVAVFNLDGPGAKARAGGRMTNFSVVYAPEAERLADLMAEVNRRYRIGLRQSKHNVDKPGNDDGSFIQEGYRVAVHNIGSCPYADPNYHLESDVPEKVDIRNAALTLKATLAAALHIDRGLSPRGIGKPPGK